GEDIAAALVVRPDAKISAHELRNFARERLAAFKVPGLIHIVPEIPKASGGKVKRGELASVFSMKRPRARREDHNKRTSARSKLECQLATIWAELLEVDHIGIEEDVFALGADSLTVTLMLARLRGCFGVDYSFEDVFNAPTVAALSARLGS